jgi:hypothetical protein
MAADITGRDFIFSICITVNIMYRFFFHIPSRSFEMLNCIDACLYIGMYDTSAHDGNQNYCLFLKIRGCNSTDLRA